MRLALVAALAFALFSTSGALEQVPAPDRRPGPDLSPNFRALPIEEKIVSIVALFADPSDFVIQADANGPCGSALYDFSRANANFDEVVSLAITAFAAEKRISIYMHRSHCNGVRNVASHIGVRR
jgi:hypothetical protein